MMGSIWEANKSHWQDDALCVKQDPDLFTPAVETPEGLDFVRRKFCNLCPVNDVCLNSAIIRNDAGYWGGTSSVNRRAMRRTRSRSQCPLCTSANLVRVPHGEGGDVTWYEVCVNCAASWKADDRPTPRQTEAEKALRRPVGPPPEVADTALVHVRRKRRPGATPVKTVPLTGDAAACL